MVKKPSSPEPASKSAEQPPRKKIAARIVKASPDEAAQQSDATPPADAKVITLCQDCPLPTRSSPFMSDKTGLILTVAHSAHHEGYL